MVLDAETGTELWSVPQRPDAYSEAVGVGEGLVVVSTGRCTSNGLNARHLTAYDARTGERRWRTKRSAVAPNGRATRIANGVITLSGNRYLGIDATDGSLQWALDPQEGVWGVATSARDVFLNAGPVMGSNDRRTGNRRWVFPAQEDPEWSATPQRTVLATNHRTTVLASGAFDYGLVANTQPTTLFVLDARTGKERARATVAAPGEPHAFGGVALGDVIAVVDAASIVGIDLETGAERWRLPLAHDPRTGYEMLSFDGGRVGVLAPSPEQEIVAFDVRTGEQLWTHADGGSFQSSGPQDSLILASFDPSQLVSLDPRTGAERWRAEYETEHGGTPTAEGAGSVVTLSQLCSSR